MVVPGTAGTVVVGAGFAGVSTAYHLTRLGVRDLLIVEQEPLPAAHSASRNAAIARTTAVPPAVAALAAEGLHFLADPPEDLRCPPLLRPCGLLALASGAEATGLRDEARERWLDRSAVERAVPATEGGDFEGALWGPGDGVVDVAMLLEAMLAAAVEKGARLLTGERVHAMATSAGRVTGVQIASEAIEARQVVVAAGAWAAEVAATGGACRVPLQPRRRHLFITGTVPWVNHHWPIVWDLTHGLFFRAEPPGLILSPCDESVADPGVPARDPAAAEMLSSKLGLFMPRLAELPLYASWAGLHTVTPDGCFVLGPDPEVEGLFWCAGLGVHGVTAAPAVGRVAAEAVLGRPVPREHDAARFAGVAGRQRRPPSPAPALGPTRG